MNLEKKRSAAVFPKKQQFLPQMGENIKLVCKRRGIPQSLIAERTGLSRLTVRKIQTGDSSVSIGHYVAVHSVLGLAQDFTHIVSDDVLGRKLQDIKRITPKRETKT